MTRRKSDNARTGRTGCNYPECSEPASSTESLNKAAISLTAAVCDSHADKDSLQEIARGEQ